MFETIAVTAVTSGSTVLVALIGKTKWDSWRGNGRFAKLEQEVEGRHGAREEKQLGGSGNGN